MAFVDWDGVPFAPAWISDVNTAAPTFTPGVQMNAAGEEAGFVIAAPKTGNLKAVGFRLTTVANNPDNGLRIAFYSLASGLPNTETHFRVETGTFTTGQFVTTGIVSDDGTDTGAKKAVTRGDRFAVVVSFASFAVGDDITVTKGMSGVFQGVGFSRGFPYAVEDVGAGWVKSGTAGEGMFDVALQYDDDVWYPIIDCLPISAIPTAVVLTSASNPREVGTQFQVPTPMRVAGFQLLATLANATTSDFDIRLYDNGTLVETVSFNNGADELGGATGTGQVIHGWFTTSHELGAGSEIHSISAVGTGAGNVTVYPIRFASTALRNASPLGGAYTYFTAASPGGAASVSTTDQFMLLPIFDGIEGSAPRARYILGGI